MEAMRVVVKKYPKAKLAIVGYGPMENKLEDMIQKYGLEKNVYLVNKNTLYFDKDPKDAKVKLMQQAWALLLPSVKEGWGMVVTEAAACSTPSIVTSVTGLIDAVEHNKTGIVVDYDISADGFANQILSLISDRAQSTTLGKTLCDVVNRLIGINRIKFFLRYFLGMKHTNHLPTISIVTATYNSIRTIERCLQYSNTKLSPTKY